MSRQPADSSNYQPLILPFSARSDVGEEKELWARLVEGFLPCLKQRIAERQTIDLSIEESNLKSWWAWVRHPVRSGSAAPSQKGATHQGKAYKLEWQWQTLERLLTCVENLGRPGDTNTLEAAIRTQGSPPDLRCHQAWAKDVIRYLTSPRESGAKSPFEVVVALTKQDGIIGETGTLAFLKLEFAEPGSGQVFIHPEDSLQTYAFEGFGESMEVAWEAAKGLVRKEQSDAQKGDGAELRDGRWRLHLPEGSPVKEVSGGSAGAAAARGWYYAFSGKVLDPRVIVLATIDRQGNCGKVEGVEEKVKAIAEESSLSIDTIAVTQENLAEAKAALEAVHKFGTITLVDIAQPDRRLPEVTAR